MLLRLLSTHSAAAGASLKAGFAKNVPTIFWCSARLCHGTGNSDVSGELSGPGGKASPEQLLATEQALGKTLSRFFTDVHNYSLYTKGVIFEDNIRHVRTTGLSAYVTQLSMVRFFAHLRYAHVRMNIHKIYTDPIESTVKVRWSIVGTAGWRVIFSLFRLNLFRIKEFSAKEGQTTDGFSIFYVNSDGKIWKHVADSMVPDDERTLAIDKKPLAAKIAAALTIGWSGAQSISDAL